jgi:hypothetical protein
MIDCFSGTQEVTQQPDGTQPPTENPIQYIYEFVTNPTATEAPNWLVIALAILALILASYLILSKRRK